MTLSDGNKCHTYKDFRGSSVKSVILFLLSIPTAKIHGYNICDLEFPTGVILKNQNLKLNENRF